jgi:UDP-N-acetylmuramoylalanine--D-glutamate ligase
MNKINYKKNTFAIIGLGDTGISIIDFLEHQNAKLLKIFDTRANPPHQDRVTNYQLHLGNLNADSFADIDVIVLSPGISIYEPVLQHLLYLGKQVVGDIELFALEIKGWNSKVIGITGSNGKTTVTSLTGHLAMSYGFNTLVAGNIGTPVLTSYLEAIKTKNIPEIIVLELSSFQLETTYNLELAAATVLNISPDHLDRYRDLLEYAYIKANIFNNAATQVLNNDDIFIQSMERSKLTKSWFGMNSSSDYYICKENNKIYLANKDNKIVNVEELQLVGQHNYLNCLASVALLSAVGINIYSDAIKQGLQSFKGLEHRMQKVTTYNGVTYIEDSKGTNVGAVIAGVSGLDNSVHLILGGDGKGQDFTPLHDLVINKCKSVAIIGQDRDKIKQVLTGINLPIKVCDSLQDAVKFCMTNAKNNEYVVLSPACASWDMFDNYKHRAQVFVDSIYANLK